MLEGKRSVEHYLYYVTCVTVATRTATSPRCSSVGECKAGGHTESKMFQRTVHLSITDTAVLLWSVVNVVFTVAETQGLTRGLCLLCVYMYGIVVQRKVCRSRELSPSVVKGKYHHGPRGEQYTCSPRGPWS